MLCPEAMAASAGGFEVSPCSLLKAPLKLNTEQQGQEGLRRYCQPLCSCPRQDQLVPVSSLKAYFMYFLYSHSPLTFLPPLAVFSVSFFFFPSW